MKKGKNSVKGEASSSPGSGNYVGAINPEVSPGSMMKYTDVKAVSAITARRHIEITPKYGGKYGPSDSFLRIEMPTVDKADPESIYFAADLIIRVGAESSQCWQDENGVSYGSIARVPHFTGAATALGNGGTAPYGIPSDTVERFVPVLNGGFGRQLNSSFNSHPENAPHPLCVYDTEKVSRDGIASSFALSSATGTDFYGNVSKDVLTVRETGPEQFSWHASRILNRYLFPPIGAGTYIVPCNGVQKMFRRIRLLQGSIVIEDIQNYNYLYAILCKSTANNAWRDTIGFMTEGLRNEYDWNQFLAAAVHSSFQAPTYSGPDIKSPPVGKRYAFRPHLGLLNCQKFWPTDLMGQFTFEFYFDDPRNFLISSVFRTRAKTERDKNDHNAANLEVGTREADNNSLQYFKTCFPNATYELQNIRMHVDFVVPVESYNQSLLDAVQSRGIEIAYDTYIAHERQINTWSGNVHVDFQERSVSIKGMYGVAVTNDNVNNIRCEMAAFSNIGLQSYQWKIGSEYMPAQPISLDHPGKGYGAVEAYVEKLRGFNQMNNLLASGLDNVFNFTKRSPVYDSNYGNGIVTTEDTPESVYRLVKHGKSHSFIFSLQLEKMITFLSGFNALSSNVNIELIMTLAQGGTAAHHAGQFYVMPCYGLAGGQTGENDDPDKALRNTLENASLLGDPFGTYGEMISNEPPTYTNLYFFAHVDALLVLKDVGAIEIRK